MYRVLDKQAARLAQCDADEAWPRVATRCRSLWHAVQVCKSTRQNYTVSRMSAVSMCGAGTQAKSLSI